MARAKFQTLTEQMFYALLCLKDECCGIDILDRIPAMTGRRVNIGSGTLYTLLEQFLEEGMIRETGVQGRRRSYILTDKGREMLEKEYERLLLAHLPLFASVTAFCAMLPLFFILLFRFLLLLPFLHQISF